MNKNKLTTEAKLDSNLNSLVHSFLRELALACRKSMIYGLNHPSTLKGVEKPFFAAGKIFNLKKYLNMNLRNGELYILNIKVKESVFSKEIIKYMQVLDVNAIVFESQLQVTELTKFLDRFVKRVNQIEHSNLIRSYLEKNNIYSIEINSELAYDLFDSGVIFRGDAAPDLSLRTVILKALPTDIIQLAQLAFYGAEFAQKLNLDFEPELIEYLIPEVTGRLNGQEVNKAALSYLGKIGHAVDEENGEFKPEISQQLYKLLEFHPVGKEIIEKMDNFIACEYHDAELVTRLKSPQAKIKFETSEVIDNLVNNIFNYEYGVDDSAEFDTAFNRLINTGQAGKALEVSLCLVHYLGDANSQKRQSALQLLDGIVSTSDYSQVNFIIEEIIRTLMKNIYEHKETYEYSDLIWDLLQRCFEEKNYELVGNLINGMNVRRQINDNITIYDSYTVKKIFYKLNDPVIINILINDLISRKYQSSPRIKNILVAINSEEVALALSRIISHPDRQVRQVAIRILSELGKASLKVFTNLIINDHNFTREADRHELPDEKWYVARNSIYIMGLLKDEKAAIPLRNRISDPDVRIRREIISALEKIRGEDAVDILMMMADDSDKEIAEAAVMTLGTIGDAEAVPLLIGIVKNNPKVMLKAIASLGRLGTSEAETFLVSLLEDNTLMAEFSMGTVAKEESLTVLVKALGVIGNKNVIDSLKDFKENQSTTQKIFFKNSSMNKTIDEILSRK